MAEAVLHDDLVSRIDGPFGSELREALARGPVVVSCAPGCLAAHRARRQVDGPALTLDAGRAGTPEGLTVDLVRRTFTADGGDRLAAAERWGDDLARAQAVSEGRPGQDFDLDAALRGVGTRATLIVDRAHVLAERWAKQITWSLRSFAQEGQPIVMVATRSRAARLLEPSAAFFGGATRVELDWSAPPARWAHESGRPVEEFEWLATRIGGHVAATCEVLDHVDDGALPDAVRAVTAARVAPARALIACAQALHPLGGRLLEAIARGDAPYAAAVGASPARVALALRILSDAGLVFQPAPRRWLLSDPLIALALRQIDEDPGGDRAG